MTDTPLHFQTLGQLSGLLRQGDLSAEELSAHFLERIAALDPTLHAFRQVTAERARTQAEDQGQVLGQTPPHGVNLCGLPYAAKDLFDVQGLATTAGSHLLAHNLAPRDSTVTARLGRQGMILVGKTHTVQFAYGGVGINHDHGTPHNPWQQTHVVPGGSSSGSAVAVAAGLVPMALGTDTGGSVRIPAALCGIVGLKTTVGQVSRSGVFPLSWSLDTVGTLTRSVEDAALVYACIQGQDRRDGSTQRSQPCDVVSRLRAGVKDLRLAFPETAFWDDVDPEFASAVRAVEAVFSELGARVESIALEEAGEALELNRRGVVVATESYAIHAARIRDHFEALDPVVSHRIRKGKEIRVAEYLGNLAAWSELRLRTYRSLRNIDALLVPTTMMPALPVAEVDANFDTYLNHNLRYLRNTSIGNVLDLCALSVPCGFTKQGLPIGLMIYGKPFAEDVVLRVGQTYEQATSWHRQTPDLSWAKSHGAPHV